jgi:hypothetical protein
MKMYDEGAGERSAIQRAGGRRQARRDFERRLMGRKRESTCGKCYRVSI